MQNNHFNGEEVSSDNPSLQAKSTTGWMSHIPALSPDQLPRAPTSFTFGANISADATLLAETLRASTSFNDYLLQNHPAYAPAASIDRQPDQGSPESRSYQSALTDSSHTIAASPNFDSIVHASTQNSNGLSSASHDQAPFQTPLYTDAGLHNHSHDQTSQRYSSQGTFVWASGLRDTRVPPPPQDVEYYHIGQQPPISQPFPSLALARLQEHNNIQTSRSTGYDALIDPDLEDPESEGQDSEHNEDGTSLQDNHATIQKRKRSNFETADDAASDSLQASTKKPRLIQPLVRLHSDSHVYTVGSNNETTLANKTKKEPRGRGRPKGQKVGIRPTLDPGPEFMSLYNQAMDAFIEHNDVVTAQTMVLQAIAINPEIFAAHSLLADIHFANKNHEKGLDALIGGLHAHMNDVELWRQVADTILADTHEASHLRLERAMYCFGGILRKDPTDMDARFQRAECARALGYVTRAFSDLNILVQDDPHNSTILAHFTQLCYDVDDAPKAKLLYDEHFEYYKINGISDEDSFTWQDVSIYIDLMAKVGEVGQAIVVLKRLSRWLCGRRDEDFWEEYLEDDREFDQMHYPRRLEADQFEPNKYSEHLYGEALPLDIRCKLGILRLRLNYLEEAQSHFGWLEPDEEDDEFMAEEYSDSYMEIAKALHDANEHEQALKFYEALESMDIDHTFEFWIGLGTSAYICEDRRKAIQAYEQALVVNKESIEARTQLAKLYRDFGDRSNALRYGREAVLLSQDAIPQTGNRKYESKENRLLREAAERALKGAYRLPRGPRGIPGRIPDSLKYRTRYKSKFRRYVPRDTETPSEESNTEVQGREKSIDRIEKANEKAVEKNAKKQKSGRHASDEAVTSTKTSTPVFKKLPRPKQKPPSKIDPFKHYEDVQRLYHNLLECQNKMREGDEEATIQWMGSAQALVDDFRTVKVFFPSERHKKFDGFTTTITFPKPRLSGRQTATQSPAPEQPSQGQSADGPASRMTPKASSRERLVDEGVTNEYCGIAFPAWLDIFLELALLTANSLTFRTTERDLQTDCYSIINAAIDCNVFYHHPRSMTQIYAVYLACCLALNDDVTLYNTVLRWFMNEFTFCTDTYRLYSAIAMIGEYSNIEGKSRIEGSMYRDSSNQKFLFRQLCSIDQQLPREYGTGTEHGPVPSFMRRERNGLRRQLAEEGDDQQAEKDGSQTKSTTATGNINVTSINPQGASPDTPVPVGSIPRRNRLDTSMVVKNFSPKEMDVVLFILYSHLMMANNSFTNALVYLYRAHSLDPTNTVCLLSMALCYLTELFKRQVGNRHALALMGWAWFGRYEAERRKWAESIDQQRKARDDDTDTPGIADNNVKMSDIVNREIEFNRARCWEMLGMTDLAVRSYKKMLAVPDPGVKNGKSQDNGKGETQDEDEEERPETWDMEAAYALSTIYMINGDGAKAMEIAEKYLVVE